jgi:REP element-mobilizing transposase RayT
MVEREFLRSSLIREELSIQSLVTMPNHLHALVTLTPTEPVDRAKQPLVAAPGACHAPLHRAPRSLGSFVSGFKGATTRAYRELVGAKDARLWQPGYYEHVVRNERDFGRISEYMMNNPFNWDQDRENANRIS